MTNEQMEAEIHSLAGETLALQSLLFQLLFHIQRRTTDPISAAFNDAADMIEAQTIAAGSKASPRHLAKSLKIVEDARAWIIPLRRSGA